MIPAKLATDNVFSQTVTEDNRTCHSQRAIILLWLLLLGVLLFSLGNWFVYLVVPSDGLQIWVRQGPFHILHVDSADTQLFQIEDQLVTIQGQPIDWWLAQQSRPWLSMIRRADQSNPTVEISLNRAGTPKTFIAPLKAGRIGSIRTQLLSHMIVSYAFLVIGAIILRFRPDERSARLTVWTMGLLALTEQVNIMPGLGAEISFASLWLFIPLRLFTRWITYAAVLHLALVFPSPRVWLARFPFLPAVIYLVNPIVTLLVMLNTPGNLHDRHAVAYPWSKNIYIFYLLLTVALLLHTYFTARNRLVKTQLMWIGWGVALAVIPNLLFGDIPVLLGRGSQMPDALGSLLLLIIPVVTAIAVLRYRLWDIDLFIRTSLVYSTLTLALGAVYFLLTFFFIRIVGSTSIDGTDRSLGSVHFIAALIVVFLFAPTYQYFKRLIDRLFYRNQIDYSQVLADLSRKLSTSLLLEDVMWLLREIIPQRLQLQGATVLLNTAPPVGSAEYQRLRAGHVVVLQHLDGQPIPRPYPLDILQLEGMWACAPLLSGDKLLGLYGIGKKKSGKYYNDKEIELIETLARQAGIALQNTQLHLELAEQVRFERDLELSRQIQESLLPAYDPVVPQLDIVGFSLPAQLVGGDFYHYFEFGADRIGIAVGDVSGKGLPAALLMAVSISTVRAHDADAAHNTAELLAKMNNLLQVQMRISKVNVAMLYAIIEHDTADRLRFRVSNAGLISPILLRPGQPCEFLDACGLPMGIVDDPLYYECAFQLCRGDLIILGSDGIVEAMNHQREMYGFERLEALINSLPDDICAGDFIKQLQASVETFVGVAPQHDDMTVVAIRVK